MLYLLYSIKIFVYFIQNLSHLYKMFTFIFYKLKYFPCVFLNFIEFLLFLWNFLKFFPQFLQNPPSFPEYFLKIFILKICLNIAWKYHECTKNVLRISYKFFRNFRAVHKISSKRLEYVINFFVQVFLKFSELFQIILQKSPSSYTRKTFI